MVIICTKSKEEEEEKRIFFLFITNSLSISPIFLSFQATQTSLPPKQQKKLDHM
jgi:hypothetical protein